jgi:hypothetical protein
VLAAGLASLPAWAQRAPKNLTGVWAGDDGATYFVMRDDHDFIWWVGMSADGGRSFTNVFRGRWQANPATEEPGDWGTVTGEWADVPRGKFMGSGNLKLRYRFSGELERIGGAGFNCRIWKKLNGGLPASIDSFQNGLPQQDNLTGIWTTGVGTYFVRQVGATVWWLGVRLTTNGTQGEIFRGTLNGTRLSGEIALPPWPGSDSPGTNDVTAQLDRAFSPTSIRASDGFYEPGMTWTRATTASQ